MKTKIFFLLLAVAASVGTLFASDTQVDGIWYDFDTSTRTASVTYRGSSYDSYSNEYSGDIVIPASVVYNKKTYSVTNIGDAAFYGCRGLTSVTIPNSVTSIGTDAFYKCTGLTSVTIPNSVTSIGNNAFERCTGLTSPVYNAHVFAFMPTSYSGAYTIPDGIESIAGYAFYKCTGLTSITIPNSVTSIGAAAFWWCEGLTSVTIGNSVTSIGRDAFELCNHLTSVTIPNSVTSIGQDAFYSCSVSTINYIGSMDEWCNKAWSPGSISSNYHLQLNGVLQQSAVIPNSVKSIGNYAFYCCSSLTSVTIPNSVTSIGQDAFYGCSVSTINYIGSMDEWCNKAWSPGSISSNYHLQLNGVLQQSAVIPNSVTSIGRSTFSCCSSLTSVTIPNSVTSIGEAAFRYCIGLTSITIPNSVTSIGDATFYGCRGLTSVTIPNSVTSIGDYAFDGCSSLSSVTIPNSVTSIGSSAFDGCSGLTSITIPNSVTSIGWSAFYGCRGLTSVTCEATTPPTCGSYAFEYVSKSIPLYVPCGSADAYRKATEWKNFTNIQPIKSDNVDITTVEVVPDETSVNIAWPQVSGAYTYELVIKDKNGQVVCTLIFDAEGRLLSIASNAPARDNMLQQTQVARFTFTVTGLNSGTTYNYSIVAKNSNGNTLNTKSGSFTTTGEGYGLQNVTDQLYETKFFRNGQLFILRDGKTYSITGQEVK